MKQVALVLLFLAGLSFFTLRSINGPCSRMHAAVRTGMTVQELLRSGTGWFSLTVAQEHDAAAEDWPSASFHRGNDGLRATYSSVEGIVAEHEYSFEDAERLLGAQMRESGKSGKAIFHFVGSPTRRYFVVTIGPDARVTAVSKVYWAD